MYELWLCLVGEEIRCKRANPNPKNPCRQAQQERKFHGMIGRQGKQVSKGRRTLKGNRNSALVKQWAKANAI